MNGQELELFRVGDYGPKGTYTDADLNDLVSRYAATGEAPVTIGHPDNDSEPAYAWIKGLRASGGTLFGTLGDVTPELDGLVQAKKYKHRSVSLSRSQDGKLQLRHVAYLGAVQPHVKGLKPAKFSSDPYEVFAFSEGDNVDEKTIKENIQEGIAAFFAKFSSKEDKPVDVAALTASVTDAVSAKFADDLKAEREARLKVEEELAAHKKQFSEGGAKSRVDAAIAKLKADGRWIPAYNHIGVPQLFSALAAHDEVITFSDDKGVEVKRDLVASFAEVLEAVGRIVPTGAIFSSSKEVAGKPAAPNVQGEVDPASATFSEMVTARANEKQIPYTEAYKQLTAEGKRPASGSAASGAV